MDKNQWMNALYAQLAGLPENERRDIMMDYEEHFAMAYAQGKGDAEIISSLGDPLGIAKQYTMNLRPAYNPMNTSMQNPPSPTGSNRSALGVALTFIGLCFFNLIFVLGPYLGLVGVLIGFYGVAAGIGIAGIAAISAPVLVAVFPATLSLGSANAALATATGSVFALSLGLGLVCMAALFMMGNVILTKFFYKLTVRYLKWNADIITRRTK